MIIIIRAVEPAVCVRTQCNSLLPALCKLFHCSLRILGYQRWVMWNGSCRQLKSWRVCCSGHTAPWEAAFHWGMGVQRQCVSGWERHGLALHHINVPVTFSVCPWPAGALGDQQPLGVQYMTVPRILFCILYFFLWLVWFPVLHSLRMRQTFIFLLFFRSVLKAKRRYFQKTLL